MRIGARTLSLLTAVCLASGLVQAAGLQVAPVTLTLEPTQQADGLWLSNTGNTQLNAQVRVFRWSQDGGQEKLEPTRALIVSPPMLQLPVDGRQLIRVIRSGPPPSGTAEESYRVLIDELPLPPSPTSPENASQPSNKGLNFVMRHSLPIFVAPAGAPSTPPNLKWGLRKEGAETVLETTNDGGTHAQLAELAFTDAAGKRTVVHPGLLGYVLPGATMRWHLKAPAAALQAQGRWQVMINGSTLEQDIAPVDR